MKVLTICILLLGVLGPCHADSEVSINVNEITVLNGTANEMTSNVPLFFATKFEFLTIAINWADTGTPNFPFPAVFGAMDDIVLDGGFMSSVCNYLVQTGPNTFQAVACNGGTLEAPFVSLVAFSGNWGSAEIGFAGNEPIDIESSFSQTTITPEPSTIFLLTLPILLGLMRWAQMSLRKSSGR